MCIVMFVLRPIENQIWTDFIFNFLLYFSIFCSVLSFIYMLFLETTVCEETHSPKSYRYHPGLWSGKKWSCCKTINRTTFGCHAATHWTETNNNPTPSKLLSFFFWQWNKCDYPLQNFSTLFWWSKSKPKFMYSSSFIVDYYYSSVKMT